MRFGNDITKNLARSGYVMNVLDGGIAMPLMSFEKKAQQYVYAMHLPGVDAESFSVEIDGMNLMIYHGMNFDGKDVPHLITRLVIPAEVDFRQIYAEYEAKRLRIVMPLNDLADGYHRDVEIIRKY